MAKVGRWVAFWDRARKLPRDPGSVSSGPSERKPAWRIAWEMDDGIAPYMDMTFGRAEDAERAIKALYTLNDWDCETLDDARAVVLRITKAQMHQTILEAMAW